MTIFNSRFRYIDENLKSPKVVDFTNLNANIEDFFIKGANVTTFIDQLTFKDHRGLEVKKLTADFTYTKKNILLEQTSINKLNGAISRIVIDSLDFNLKVSGELLNFESNFRNLSNKIKSKELKNLFKLEYYQFIKWKIQDYIENMLDTTFELLYENEKREGENNA
jgi:hypothetical protein